jgi:hypothetical protein
MASIDDRNPGFLRTQPSRVKHFHHEEFAMGKTGVLIAVVLVAAVAGCGRPSGPPTFTVTGRVTFDGRPVPVGRVLLEPDASRGNMGPASVADIVAGRYRTRPGRGCISGPSLATIYGGDGTLPTEEHDTALFAPWTTAIDLPRADGTQDFDVPARP